MFLDNTFNVNNNDFNNISSLLYTALLDLYNYNDITSSYITSYKNSSDKGQLNITILIKDDANIHFYNRIVSKLNRSFAEISRFPVLFCVDYEHEYIYNVDKSSTIIHIEELLKSEILFDKNFFLSSIKNEFNDHKFIYDFDLIEFNPSIGQNVAFRLFKNI